MEAKEERRRTEGVVRELARRTRLPISIDTTKASVAAAAVDAGAEIVNDVSGGARDPALFRAASGTAFCLMHMRGTPQEMQSRAVYSDLHGEVERELTAALERARAAGIPEDRVALDPGLGFAKTGAHNLTLLRRLRELTQLGRPLLVGASRKSFIGKATGKPAPAERDQSRDAFGPRRRGAYVRCLTVRRKLAALPTRHQHCFSLREHSTWPSAWQRNR